MKVLLINSNRLKHPWPVIPFGLCSIAATLEDKGHDVQLLDLCFSKNTSNDIYAMIERCQPDVVGSRISNDFYA
jgi:tRNA A-37 threonylcarbamoyl transferase component Bud32